MRYTKSIRPISISIIRNGENILVYERQDDKTNKKFYRLVGGCIEFGETSTGALKREFYEELSLRIINVKLLKSFESIFVFNDKKMHEIVYLFESEFEDRSVYNMDNLKGLEGDREFVAKWISASDFTNRKYVIFPEEVLFYL